MDKYYYHGFSGARKYKRIIKNGLRSNNLHEKEYQHFGFSDPNSLYLTKNYILALRFARYRARNKKKYIAVIPAEAVNPNDLIRYDEFFQEEYNEIAPCF